VAISFFGVGFRRGGPQSTRRFTTPTDSVAAARSNVAPEKFRAITRTVLLVQQNAAG